jgi:hypothetical protein
MERPSGTADWYEPPDAAAIPLGETPLLESWDSHSAPAQIRLAGYVTRLNALVAGALDGVAGPLAVELVIGRERWTPGDLDNFLTPVARAVGRADVVSYRSHRDDRAPSSISVGLARPSPPPGPGSGWDLAVAETTVSAQTATWKQSVSDQVGRHPTAEGDELLELVLCLHVGPGRNWISLWKPAIDALGGILGLTGTRAWHPRDDRIARLALHRTVDPALGWNVRVGVWWRPLRRAEG